MTDMNSGYSGYSMSKNAVDAYECGEKPLSRWTKTDIIEKAAEVIGAEDPRIAQLKYIKLKVLKERLLRCTSWHHTSSYVNATDFYSFDEEAAEALTEEDIEEMRMPSARKEEREPVSYRGEIRFLEWSGTRNHPKAKEKTLESVKIVERGSFYWIYDDYGTLLLRKKIGSNGTVVRNYEEEYRRAADENKNYR